MNLSYKYRLYPSRTQARQLEMILDISCRVYNDLVHQARVDYEDGIKWNWQQVSKFWRAEREKHSIIAQHLHPDSVDVLVKRYDYSLKSFWALRKNGHEDAMPPGEMPRRKFKTIGYRYRGKGAKLIEDYEGVARLQLYAVDGLIRMHYHRPIPAGWRALRCLVKKSKRDQWYAILQVEGVEDHVLSERALGIDVGFYSLLAFSNGEVIDNPRWYRKSLSQRRTLMRQADRRRRASNPDNYNADGTVKENAIIWRKSSRLQKTERQLRRIDEKIAQRRRQYYHEVVDRLTDHYGLIAIEDLSPQFTIHNKHLSISAHDAAWTTFQNILEYKCQLRGVELIKVNPANTSQMCSGCGAIVKKDLAERTHRCVSCGLEIDRDVNAARNILDLAIHGPCRGQRDVTQAVGSSVSRNGSHGVTVAMGETS